MEKILNYILAGFGMLSCLGSCSSEEVTKYENDPRLYFFWGNLNYGEFTQYDSLKYSFFVKPDTQLQDTVYLDIRAMGNPTDYPRPIKLVQTNMGTSEAAIPGKHYIAFDDPEMQGQLQMDRGAVRKLIPIILLRKSDLNKTKVRLEMAIRENEYFKVGMDSLSHFLVTSTAMPERPKLWNSYWKWDFGTYGPKKLWFLVQYVGLTDFDSYISDSEYKTYLVGKAIQKLEEYNTNENNPDRPLREDDGTLVDFNV